MGASGDKRQFPRVPFFVPLELSSAALEAPIEANGLDVSLSGVRLICCEPVPVGEEVRLTLRLKQGRKLRVEDVRGRVVRVQGDDDVWIVGIEFSEVLSARKTPLWHAAVTDRK
jgi:hypothetical protein